MTIKFPGDHPDAIVECARRLAVDVERLTATGARPLSISQARRCSTGGCRLGVRSSVSSASCPAIPRSAIATLR